MNLSGLLNRSRLSFAEFWTARDARERSMVAVAALVVIFGLGYAVLIAPAMAGREKLNKNMPLLRQQVAQMRALSGEAAGLAAKPATTQPALTRENIDAALARNGLKSQNVMLSGDFAKVQLANASFANTLYWLDEMQRTALLAVTDANIIALAAPDMIDATITLRLPAHE